MGRGFLAGIFWGGIVGIGLLLVSSQTLDRQQLSFPRPEAAAVEVPGGSEFDQARIETEPLLPGTEEAPAGEVVTGVIPPEDAVDTPPAFDTSSLDVPQPAVEGPAGLGDAPEVADEVEVPAGGEGARVGSAGNVAGVPASPSLEAPETPIAAPETDTAAPEPGAMPDVETPEIAETPAEEPAPETGAEIAALPTETQSEDTPLASETPPEVMTETDAPSSPVSPEVSEAPSLPGVVAIPEPEEAPAGEEIAAMPQEAAPEIAVEAQEAPTEAPAMEAAEVEEAPSDAGTADAAEQQVVEPGPAPDVVETPDSGGVVTVDGGDSQFFTPVESFEDRAENVETNRLPTIGGDEDTGLPVVRRLPGTPVTEEPADEGGTDVAEAPTAAEGPAIQVFAMPFDAPADIPKISIILLQEGAEPLSPTELSRLPETVAFAVDAGDANAARIAAAYRSAGREVVLIPSLPSGATPQDVEVALAANLDAVPEAVAVMDVSGSAFQSDRAAVAQVVAVISDSGHGIVTVPRGLNTAHQEAGRAGVPRGLIFRLLDDDGEAAEQIRRTLDRAAFRARQNDAVILVGHTRPETLAVLREWAADLDDSVIMAPVSASLGE